MLQTKPILALALLLAGLSTAAIPKMAERKVERIAEGVYVILHKDVSDGWPEGNTTIVIGDRGVFVVDSCLLTATAKEDVAEIRKLTSKPVRYLLNTHWHIDHNAGNSVYVDAFPGIEIVAQTNTKRIMDGKNRGVAMHWAAADGPMAKAADSLRKQMATGKDEDGKQLSAQESADLPRQIADEERQINDFRTLFKYQSPTLTFDRELTLDLGNREVRILNMGRATTDGDAFVYLPMEKILITGDVVVWPLPYAGGSFPSEWKQTLEAMSRMDATRIVPGHGPVLKGMAYVNELIELISSVTRQVRERVPSMRSIPIADFKPAMLNVDLERFRKSMAGDDPERLAWFNQMVGTSLVKLVYQEFVGNR